MAQRVKHLPVMWETLVRSLGREDPMDCSLAGSSLHGILQARVLEWVAITFLPRSKHLLISWLQSPSAVILEPEKVKSITVSIVSPSISHEVMGPHAMILVF